MKQTIDSIAAVNVKGRNFNHALKPLTVIHGENAAGKTAITDAIQIALLGHHPSLGKKPASTMALCPASAKQLEVQMKLADGTAIRRTYTRTRTGASEDTHGAIPDGVLPAQLNFGEFLKAKPAERNAVLATIMGEIDLPALQAKIKAKAAELGVLDHVDLTIDPGAERPLDTTIQAIGEQAVGMKQTLDQLRKTIATMLQAEPPEGQYDPGAITALRSKLDEANAAVGAAGERLDALNRAIMQAPDEPLEARPEREAIESAKDAHLKASAALTAALTAKESQTHLIQRIAQLERDINGLEAIASGRPDERPTCTASEAEIKAAELKRDIDSQNRELATCREEIAANQREASNLIGSIRQLEAGTCPCCGSTGEALATAIETMVASRDACFATIEHCQERLKVAEGRREKMQAGLAHYTAVPRAIAGWEAADKIPGLQDQLAELKQEAATQPDTTALQGEVDKTAAELQRLERLEDEWRVYRAAELPSKEDTEAAAEAFVNAKHERDQIAAEIKILAERNAAHERALQDKQRVADMTAEAENLERLLAGAKALREHLKEIQREAATEAMRPLILTAGIFLEGLVEGHMEVEQHLVGIRRAGEFLPLEVLSGMEAVAVAAACQAALAHKSPVPILIVDELARMTPSKRAIFSRNCQAAIEAGVVGQVILIDQTPDAHPGVHDILTA